MFFVPETKKTPLARLLAHEDSQSRLKHAVASADRQGRQGEGRRGRAQRYAVTALKQQQLRDRKPPVSLGHFTVTFERKEASKS